MAIGSKLPILNGQLQSNLDANSFSITNLTGTGAGSVTNVTGDNGSHVGLTLAVTNPTSTPALALGGTLNWASLNKSGSSLGDLATRTFSLLTSVPSNVTNALNSTLNLSDLANAATSRTNLGLGSAAVAPAGAFLNVANNLSDTDDPVACVANLGLSTVATSGAYSDLTGKPTVPTITGSSVLKGSSGNAVAATAKTDYWDTSVFGASGASHAKGLVPDPGGSAGSAKFLREDGTWQNGLGSGGVSGFSFTNGANFVGTVTNGSSTPALALVLGDASDTTKTFSFDASGITTSTNRVIKVPNINTSLPKLLSATTSNFVTGLDSSGNLTIAQPAFTDVSGSIAASQLPAFTGDVTTVAGAVANTIAGGAVTFSKMANLAANSVIGNNTAGATTASALSPSQVLDIIGSTRGNILYRGASGWATLANGTAGQVLQANGVGSDPTWASSSGFTGGTLSTELILSSTVGPTSPFSTGFRGIPLGNGGGTISAAYTAVLNDAGKALIHDSADNTSRAFTIPANASVAYPLGTALTFINLKNTVTIPITSDTMTLVNSVTTGTRTLALNGIATAVKVGTTSWLISGTGLT